MDEIALKIEYYKSLDSFAREIASDISNKPVTGKLLGYIKKLYHSANTEKDPRFQNENFVSAYHPPVTPELEFILARIFYHYSVINRLGWKIKLRKQEKKTAPDIRIEKNGEDLVVIEIKAKVGWMQWFFSERKRKGEEEKGINVKAKIEKEKAKIEAYYTRFGVPGKNVFFIIPTLREAHRKKLEANTHIEDYKDNFAKNSGLPKNNLIVLSNNLNLNLDSKDNTLNEPLTPTDDFENLFRKTLIELTNVGR